LMAGFSRACGGKKPEYLRLRSSMPGNPCRPILVNREKRVPKGIDRWRAISSRLAPMRNNAKARILLTIAWPSVWEAFSTLLSE
ncbi:hypothetical protein MYX78_11830, partial [Acidobacteria bacterium AH-259-G07]|nr:hypothetical protein [Acidobacteria bacterium AH-259-G07]